MLGGGSNLRLCSDLSFCSWSLNPLQHSRNSLPYLFIYLFSFLQPHLQCMEVPGLGVESELQLLLYATAIPT